MEITEKWLGEIGGWAVMKAARSLVDAGLAADCGGVFVRLAPAGSFDSNTAHMLKECAEYLASVADAQSDRRVTPEEFHRAKSNAHEWIAAILQHVEGLRVSAGVEQ